MKRLFAFVCVLCALSFVACLGSDDSGDGGKITMTPAQKENLLQQVEASATEAKSVTFTTADAWSSNVEAVRSAEVDWVSITPDHGDAAGTYTVEITLSANDTGEERQAYIVITCGETRITILIVQSAAEDPSDDNPSDNVGNVVNFRDFPGPKIKTLKQYSLTADGELNKLQSTWTFKYEADGELLSEVTYRWGDGEYDYEKYTFTYPAGTDNQLVMKCDQWYPNDYGPDGSPTNYEYYGYENIMTLNSKGYIVSFYQPGYEDEVGTLEYNEDQLVRFNYGDGGHTEYRWDTWTMVYQKYDEMDDGQYVREHTLTPSKLYGSPFWYSQVDPTMLCQEKITLLQPWAWGFAGDHNQSLYESISTDGGKTTISFEYEFDGEQMVMGNPVALISRVTTSYSVSDETSRECYLFEYYTE